MEEQIKQKKSKINIEDEVIKIMLIRIQCSCQAERYKDCYCGQDLGSLQINYESEEYNKLRKNTKHILEGLQDVFFELVLSYMQHLKLGSEQYLECKSYEQQFKLLQQLLIDQIKMKTKVKKEQQTDLQKLEKQQKKLNKKVCDKCQQVQIQ